MHQDQLWILVVWQALHVDMLTASSVAEAI